MKYKIILVPVRWITIDYVSACIIEILMLYFRHRLGEVLITIIIVEVIVKDNVNGSLTI